MYIYIYIYIYIQIKNVLENPCLEVFIKNTKYIFCTCIRRTFCTSICL